MAQTQIIKTMEEFALINYQGKKELNIFRLAATLYRDEKYQIGRTRTILKIIESLFLESNNAYSTIENLVSLCTTNYSLHLEEQEISNAINSNQKYFEIKNLHNSDSLFRLTEKRFDLLLEKTENLSIEKYIDLYLLAKYNQVNSEAKNTIFKFLYSTFTSNLNNYRVFLNAVGSEVAQITSSNFESKDVDLINGFLNFDNNQKDKAIFNIISLSLEYCLLTGNKSTLDSSALSNKHFYLDSNMIYRAIGINGLERKSLTIRFLETCMAFGIKFHLLKITHSEFIQSIDYKTNNIYKFQHKHISRKVFKKYTSDDFCEYYYEWSKNKVNPNKDLFISYIMSIFEQLKTDYKIQIDYVDHLTHITDEDVQLVGDAIRSKKSNRDRNATDFVIENDTKMILSLRELRKSKRDENKSILGTQYYLISTDQQLRDWEAVHYDLTPIILLPSQWMTIMYRYSSRTNDDYKSFVSFLTLKNNDNDFHSKYSVDRIHTVLSGISEITEDVSQQQKYADLIIERDILGLINAPDKNQLYEKSIEYVKEDLGSQLTKIQEQLSQKNKAHTESEEKVDELVKEIGTLSNNYDAISKEAEKLRGEALTSKIGSDFKKWQQQGCYSSIGLLIVVFWTGMHFVAIDHPYNIYTRLLSYIDTLPALTKEIFIGIDIAIITSLFGSLIYFTYNRVNKNSEKAKNKLAEISANYHTKYKAP